MICEECGVEIKTKECGDTCWSEPVREELLAKRYDIPFYCTLCGAIRFSCRAITAFTLIWPLMYFEEVLRDSVIIIPKSVKKSELSDFGVILSIGPGYHRSKKYYPTPEELHVGIKVVYDKTVPGRLWFKGTDGRGYEVMVCGVADVMAVVSD